MKVGDKVLVTRAGVISSHNYGGSAITVQSREMGTGRQYFVYGKYLRKLGSEHVVSVGTNDFTVSDSEIYAYTRSKR